MKMRLLSFALFAATVFTIGSSVPAYAEGPKIIRTPDSRVVLILNEGKPEHVKLQDLADGASKTITTGNHTVTVTRQGSNLLVNLDGKNLTDAELTPTGKDGKPMMFVMRADGKEAGTLHMSDSRVIVLKDNNNNTLKVVANSDTKEVTVFQNDASQTIRLNDLAEGETRTFASGQHNVTVTRQGDNLVLKVDGKDLPMARTGGGEKNIQIFVDKDGNNHNLDGKDFVFVRKGEPGEHRVVVQEVVTADSKDGAKESKVRVMLNSNDQKVNVDADGQVYAFSAQGMADGESRTFTAGTHKVVVTKNGDRFSVTVDDK